MWKGAASGAREAFRALLTVAPLLVFLVYPGWQPEANPPAPAKRSVERAADPPPHVEPPRLCTEGQQLGAMHARLDALGDAPLRPASRPRGSHDTVRAVLGFGGGKGRAPWQIVRVEMSSAGPRVLVTEVRGKRVERTSRELDALVWTELQECLLDTSFWSDASPCLEPGEDGEVALLEAAVGARYNAVLDGTFGARPPASRRCAELLRRVAERAWPRD